MTIFRMLSQILIDKYLRIFHCRESRCILAVLNVIFILFLLFFSDSIPSISLFSFVSLFILLHFNYTQVLFSCKSLRVWNIHYGGPTLICSYDKKLFRQLLYQSVWPHHLILSQKKNWFFLKTYLFVVLTVCIFLCNL